jgi:hypothetical protein
MDAVSGSNTNAGKHQLTALTLGLAEDSGWCAARLQPIRDCPCLPLHGHLVMHEFLLRHIFLITRWQVCVHPVEGVACTSLTQGQSCRYNVKYSTAGFNYFGWNAGCTFAEASCASLNTAAGDPGSSEWTCDANAPSAGKTCTANHLAIGRCMTDSQVRFGVCSAAVVSDLWNHACLGSFVALT